ncbi:putative amino-acid permease P7G5.06 [Exophiala dermatitidis]
MEKVCIDTPEIAVVDVETETVEFVLGVIKLVAMAGFIIFGIIVSCGGVPTDTRGYIGFRYWDGADGNHAFRNGFAGFCSVFVLAAFAYEGSELVGLAAAEAKDPRKSFPKATKQVLWSILGVYVLSSLIVGIIVPNNSPDLLYATGANTKASPSVLAIQYAGVRGPHSLFNAAITVSTLSVANSATYGSTRTLQALAQHRMAPRFLAYVDGKGRPIGPVIVLLLMGLLAFISLSAAGDQVRFRQAWKAAGKSIDDLPFKSQLGTYGSYVTLFMAVIVLIAAFYVALFPAGAGTPNAIRFFQNYLSAPV